MIPFQICFRNLPPSDFIWIDVQQRIEKLERFFDHIVSCNVVISAPHRHHHKGKIPHVEVRLHVPGANLIVNRELEKDRSHEDIYIVIADAFQAVTRQLEDYVRRKRQYVKERHALPHAFVSQLSPDGEFGFIQTSDGRELYFHQNAVLDGKIENLRVGTEVRFAEEVGEKGPQVSTLHVVGKFNKRFRETTEGKRGEL